MLGNRKATLFACDEILFSLHGKIYPNGIYTTDIGIPNKECNLSQLAFLFLIELSVEDPCKEIIARVEFPGSTAPQQTLYQVRQPPLIEGRKTFVHKVPILAQSLVVTPGPIKGFVHFGDEEVLAGQQWIVLSSPPQVIVTPDASLQKKRKK